MQAIADLPYRDITQFLPQTSATFIPLLEKNRKEIESIKKETFQYGTTERHKLDIYNPPNNTAEKVPIILFTYGGGFQVGDRDQQPYNGLVWANFGSFFAKQGFLVVIADYRLSPVGQPDGARYPDACIDLKDALKFIVSDEKVNKVADTGRIYLLGQSAGGMIQTTLLFHPTMLPEDLRARIKGGVFNGGMYDIPLDPAPVPFNSYFDVQGEKDTPYTLIQKASEESLKALPPLKFMIAEKELETPEVTTKEMVKLLRERGVANVEDRSSKGHNHVSVALSLATGEGEEWAYEAARWMKAH